MGPLLFIFATLLLFFLPFVPALVELRKGTDKLPLKVVQDYDIDIRHFAHNFRSYLEQNLPGFFDAVMTALPQRLRDGAGYFVVNGGKIPGGRIKDIVLAKSFLTLPENVFFEKEVYSQESIVTGLNSQFRALLSDNDIEIRDGSTVFRWVHCKGSLISRAGCSLYGRASADKTIFVAEDCLFERLNAPKILFGKIDYAFKNPQERRLNHLQELPNVKDHSGRRWLISGHLTIENNHFFDGDIVTSGTLQIEANAHIRGSLKSNGDLYLGDNVIIEGAVFSTGNLFVGRNCILSGPVIAEKTLTIEEGSAIGSPAAPTSIGAPVIEINGSVMTFGTVWADDHAIVKS